MNKDEDGFIKISYKKTRKNKKRFDTNLHLNNKLNQEEHILFDLQKKINYQLQKDSSIEDINNINIFYFQLEKQTFWQLSLIVILKIYQKNDYAKNIFWNLEKNIFSKNQCYKINSRYVAYNIVCWWNTKHQNWLHDIQKVIRKLHEIRLNIFQENKDGETPIMSLNQNKNLSIKERYILYDLLTDITDEQINDIVDDVYKKLDQEFVEKELDKLKFCLIKNPSKTLQMLSVLLLKESVNENQFKYEETLNIKIEKLLYTFNKIDEINHRNSIKDLFRFFTLYKIDREKILEKFFIMLLGETFSNSTLLNCFGSIIGIFESHSYFVNYSKKVIEQFLDTGTKNEYVLDIDIQRRVEFIIRYMINLQNYDCVEKIKNNNWILSIEQKMFFENIEKNKK